MTRSASTRSALRRGMIAVAGVAALTAGALAAPTGAVAATETYYTAQPLCAPATAHHASCFALKRVKHTRKVDGAVPAKALPRSLGVGPDGGYTPGDIATAYGVSHSAATTQTVGIVDAFNDPNARADLNHFDNNYGLPTETTGTFRQVNQTGQTSPLPTNNAGWAGEESLDLDAVRGICNHCKIILVEATNNSTANLAAAAQEAYHLGARIISNSYGVPETARPSDAVLNDYNHPKTVITASAGDDGFFDWDYFNDNPTGTNGDPTFSSEAPEFPASDNTVVAVGGTSLQLNGDGSRAGETVWNENGAADNAGYYAEAPQGAGGGGCSTLFNARSFQSSAAHYSGAACGSKRLVNDISALADPFFGYDIYDSVSGGGWQTFGGTSLAAPLIAAMWGLAGGAHGVDYPAQTLYSHFKSNPGSTLHDVTLGGNGFCDGVSPGECGSQVGYPSQSPNTLGFGTIDCAWKNDSRAYSAGIRACEASTGYDGPTGVGTPRSVSLFKP